LITEPETTSKEIPQAEIDRWSIDSDTPAGKLRHLGHCAAVRDEALLGPKSLRPTPAPPPNRIDRRSDLRHIDIPLVKRVR
jgi:hypothetical protein